MQTIDTENLFPFFTHFVGSGDSTQIDGRPGPLELSTLCALCVSAQVRATLYNKKGEKVGFADEHGEYELFTLS